MSAITKHTYKQIKSLLNGCIIYLETEDNRDVTDYLKANLEEIQAFFKTKYKSFIIASNIELNPNLKEAVSYFYPRINFDTLNFSVGNSNQYLLELFGFNNQVRTGLLSIDTETTFTDLSNIKIEDLKRFINQYVNNIHIDDFDDFPFFDTNFDDKIILDNETQELVSDVIKKFNALKDNGNFLAVLPIIEKYIKENNNDLDDLSSLLIDSNYNIYLPDYNNLEIKLSHLSKCVYFLFLNHPEGIYLKELPSYKEELIGYYKRISNRLDYDKMLVSIDDIINTETNAVYVHLSRIKSVFTKKLHTTIAENYYIQGGKERTKNIKLDEGLIKWERPFINFLGLDTLLEIDDDE